MIHLRLHKPVHLNHSCISCLGLRYPTAARLCPGGGKVRPRAGRAVQRAERGGRPQPRHAHRPRPRHPPLACSHRQPWRISNISIHINPVATFQFPKENVDCNMQCFSRNISSIQRIVTQRGYQTTKKCEPCLIFSLP